MKQCCRDATQCDETKHVKKVSALRSFAEGVAGMFVFPRNFLALNMTENLFDIEQNPFKEVPLDERLVPQ